MGLGEVVHLVLMMGEFVHYVLMMRFDVRVQGCFEMLDVVIDGVYE